MDLLHAGTHHKTTSSRNVSVSFGASSTPLLLKCCTTVYLSKTSSVNALKIVPFSLRKKGKKYLESGVFLVINGTLFLESG